MSIIFEKLVQHANDFENILSKHSFRTSETHPYNWQNTIFESAYVRRAHLDIIDVRDTKKLFMMHLCVFPKTWDPAPIYGFDIVAGPNKITGAFHDFSPTGDKHHPMMEWFGDQVGTYDWSKPRTLPEWAKSIFSHHIIAAGNIQTEFELNEILSFSKKSLEYYMETLPQTHPKMSYEDKIKGPQYTEEQNHYCKNQKKNPHTPKVMESLGFEKETIQSFIETCLFPEIT